MNVPNGQATVKLFIATSLDGFIADQDGGVDWLFSDADYGYRAFFSTVGALIMGRRTFDQILGFGPWPYENRRAYVFTNRRLDPEHPHAEAVQGHPGTVLRRLRLEVAGDLWLVGGADLASQMRLRGLIDELIVSIHPTVLGEGIPLFTPAPRRDHLELLESRAFPSGLVQLRYALNSESRSEPPVH